MKFQEKLEGNCHFLSRFVTIQFRSLKIFKHKVFLGFDFMAVFLSFAPGGIHEMVVISVAYNIDPIFVSYNHFLRIFFIIFLIPFILKIIKRD